MLCPSASTRVRHTRAAVAARRLAFEVPRCRTSKLARCFLPALVWLCMEWPFQHCVWYRNVGWVQGCRQPLVASLNFVFFSFPRCRCLWGWETTNNNFGFPHGPMLPVLIIIITHDVDHEMQIYFVIIRILTWLLSDFRCYRKKIEFRHSDLTKNYLLTLMSVMSVRMMRYCIIIFKVDTNH